MPKYKIRVQKTAAREATIEVEADNEEDAVDAVCSAEAPVIVELLEKAEWEPEDSVSYDVIEEPEEIVP